MDSSVPSFTPEQKQQYRRYFAALEQHNRRERQWKRNHPVNPALARQVGEALWRAAAERSMATQGDTASDDEAESRVARAIFALGAHRRAGQGA